MSTRAQFRLLRKLFRDRFFENDDVSPGAGFETNIYQVMGFLATVGFAVAYLLGPAYSQTLHQKTGAELSWALRAIQLVSPACTFAVIGFTAFFEWDMLFPGRRDFLILAPFPIRLRDLFAAQFTALAEFVLLLMGALNVFPAIVIMLVGLFAAHYHGMGLRLVAAHLISTAGVALFAFLAVAALQGLLITLTSPRIFRRISPAIQMLGMSSMVLSILTFPIYVLLLRPAVLNHRLWLWFFPPVWFTGLFELFLKGGSGLFAGLGVYALRMLGAVAAVFCATWALGFQRHYRRTLEAEDVTPRPRPASRLDGLSRSAEERAIFRFSGQTLARSRKHQMFLVTYVSVGISIAVNFATAIRGGSLAPSDDGMRAFPFFIAFFVISGLRAVFQFPSELASNWLFRLTEDHWVEKARSATRKRVLVSGLVPALVLLVAIQIVAWGGWRIGWHAAFQLAAGALLIEGMFWTFDKVPFTCSYFPGKTNLSILFVIYLYGLTTYSFHLADLELAAEQRWSYGLLYLAVGAVLLVLAWRRHPPAEAVRFDASEPVIRTLDLN